MCLSLPETTERPSHGTPSFFIRDNVCFVSYMDNHHAKAKPEQCFVPPYVGFRGWIGVRLDRGPDWDGVERIIHDANLAVAPKKVAATFLDR